MCAVFGVLDFQNKPTSSQRRLLFQELACAAQARGTDASGVAYVQNGAIQIQKAPRPAYKMRWRINANAQYLMGHTRMTTQGAASKNYNNHPFLGKAGKQGFALAHNGVICNDLALRKSCRLPDSIIETDSYVAVQLLEKAGNLSAQSLKLTAELLEGSFTITVLDAKNTMYLIRGNNPLTIRLFPELGCYLYASTGEILEIALTRLGLSKAVQADIPIKQGDIMTVNAKGERSLTHFNNTSIQAQRYFSNWNWYEPAIADEPDDYLQMVLEYGQRHGVPERELRLLLDSGYDVFDVEQLIHDGQSRRICIQEIMAGYGVY